MILLLGASGLLGHNVLLKLLDGGYRVVALVRDDKSIADMCGNSLLTVVKGSCLDVEILRKTMCECDAVINCAGTTDMSLLKYDDYLPVNRDLCEKILQLMDECDIHTYVHISSANTIGYGAMDHPGDESCEMRSPFSESYYAKSKREAEAMLEWYAMEHPQGHVIILNPGFMIGPYDAKPSSGKLLLAGYKRRLMAAPSGGKSFVHVADVAQAVVNALTMGHNGERYLLTGESLFLRDFYALQASVCGYRQSFVSLPPAIVRLAGRVGDLLRYFGIRTQLSTRNVRQLLAMEYYSNAKARSELAFSTTPIQQAIIDFFDWQNSRSDTANAEHLYNHSGKK